MRISKINLKKFSYKQNILDIEDTKYAYREKRGDGETYIKQVLAVY